MGFIRWFKGSLEDNDGTASFRRIYNWLIVCLVIFVVVYSTLSHTWSNLLIYVLLILLIAGFLNTSVITVDNILRFFNRDKEPESQPAQPQKADITGEMTITSKQDQS